MSVQEHKKPSRFENRLTNLLTKKTNQSTSLSFAIQQPII